MREQNQLYDRLRESEESREKGVKLFNEKALLIRPGDENYTKIHGNAFSEYIQYIQAAYSNGKSLDFIEDLSQKAADAYIEADGNISLGTIFGYNYHLYLFSLAVLFEFSEEKVGLMARSWDKVDKPYEDHLIDTLISSQIPSRSRSQHQIFPTVYSPLVDAIREEDPAIREQKIKRFVLLQWRDGHKGVDNASVNAHKNQSYMFFGYWSFETAAFISMLNIPIDSHDYGEYFPYSFFGMSEVLPQKHNSKSPKTKIVFPPKSPNYTLRVPEDWDICDAKKFTVSAPGGKIKFSVSFHHGHELNFLNNRFGRVLEVKEEEMPWIQLREKPYTKSLPPRKHGAHFYHIAEYVGILPKEGNLLRYFLACEQIGETVVEYLFVAQSKGFGKYMKDIRLILGSVEIKRC